MNCVQRLSLMTMALGLTWVGSVPAVRAQDPAAPAQPTAPAPPIQPDAAPGQTGGMTQAEVAERLNIVPVFVVVSQDGTPILANVEQEGTNVQVANFWLDKVQADEAIKQIQAANPDIGSQAQVLPISLGYAYEVAESEKVNNGDVVFQVLPRQTDLQSALAIVQANGQTDIQEFPGIPLFYGVSDQGLLTVERDGVEVVPFFFSQNDLTTTLQRASGSDPSIASATRVEVTTLSQVVDSMLDPNAETDVSKIAFVPAKEALEVIQSLDPEVFNNLFDDGSANPPIP